MRKKNLDRHGQTSAIKSQLRGFLGAAGMKKQHILAALALVCLSVGIVLNSHVRRTELSENLALELAEGKESEAERESIRMGGTV